MYQTFFLTHKFTIIHIYQEVYLEEIILHNYWVNFVNTYNMVSSFIKENIDGTLLTKGIHEHIHATQERFTMI